jgi:hypothetical protein
MIKDKAVSRACTTGGTAHFRKRCRVAVGMSRLARIGYNYFF